MEYFGNAIAVISSLITVLSGIYYFKKLNAGQKWVLYFFILSSCNDFGDGWLALHKIHNHWLVNIFTLFEFSFFVSILNNWVKSRAVHRFSIIAAAFFLTSWVYCILSAKTLGADTFLADLTECIVIMLLSAYVLGTLSMATEYPVLKNYKFWFAGVSFIYYSIGILINYIFDALIEHDPAYNWGLWSINTTVTIITNILYAYVFYLKEG
jgi:hypothetical protein